jgi:hypothetical protein
LVAVAEVMEPLLVIVVVVEQVDTPQVGLMLLIA